MPMDPRFLERVEEHIRKQVEECDRHTAVLSGKTEAYREMAEWLHRTCKVCMVTFWSLERLKEHKCEPDPEKSAS